MNEYCPECGSNQIVDRWPTRRIANQKIILWCGQCGLGWQHPLPTPEEIKSYYRSLPPYVIQGEKEKKEGFRRRIHQLAKLMPERGKLLDVGSGLGHFLHMAQQDGWDVEGIEPQTSAATYCQEKFGIEPHIGNIEESEFDPGSFDVVTLWDVLEHVHHPSHFLTYCIRLIAPGGLIVIAIPNSSGWPARLFKGRWRYVMFTHLNYYTRAVIEKQLADNNIQIEKENHTIKIQSLLQGIESLFPFSLQSERLIRMGRKETIERNRPEKQQSLSLSNKPAWLTNTIYKIRRLILKLNLMPLTWPIGDLMDLYGRKRK